MFSAKKRMFFNIILFFETFTKNFASFTKNSLFSQIYFIIIDIKLVQTLMTWLREMSAGANISVYENRNTR